MKPIHRRIRIPARAKAGEIIKIRTLITHAMENGFRPNPTTGGVFPRKIINRFVCLAEGTTVFEAKLHEAVASNPFIVFHMVARKTTTLEFFWYEDGGAIYKDKAILNVA